MNLKMTNKVYDVLKYITMIVLPASGAFYFAISQVWGLQYAAEVVGTISALTTFMGAVLGISTKNYNNANGEDGTLELTEGKIQLNMTRTDEEIQAADFLRLSVKKD